MKVLISTCLLGVACKYSGGDNARPALVAALQAAGHELVPVCPEVYGGTIYDGTFSGKKIPGSGVAAELLEQNGIAVYTDEDCAAALPF